MSALTDIAPTYTVVEVQGHEIKTYGLTAEQIAKVFIRFPRFRALLQEARDLIGSGDGFDFENAAEAIDHKALGKVGKDVIGAIIAYATRADDDPKAEAVASELGAGLQIKFLKAAYLHTFPNGLWEAMATLGLDDGSDEAGE